MSTSFTFKWPLLYPETYREYILHTHIQGVHTAHTHKHTHRATHTHTKHTNSIIEKRSSSHYGWSSFARAPGTEETRLTRAVHHPHSHSHTHIHTHTHSLSHTHTQTLYP